MSEQEIKQFFISHPAISIKIFEEEAKVPFTTISKFMKGRGLPEKHFGKIKEVMIKYGFK